VNKVDRDKVSQEIFSRNAVGRGFRYIFKHSKIVLLVTVNNVQ